MEKDKEILRLKEIIANGPNENKFDSPEPKCNLLKVKKLFEKVKEDLEYFDENKV